METTSALHSALDKYPSLITFWSSSSASSPATLLRPRHGKITAASGSNTRVPCAKRDVLPIRTAQNQRVSDRAENCGKGVAVGVAQRGGGWQALTRRIGGPELDRYEHG